MKKITKAGKISLYGFCCGYVEVIFKKRHSFTIGKPGMYFTVSHYIGDDSQGRKLFSHLTDARKYVSSYKVQA